MGKPVAYDKVGWSNFHSPNVAIARFFILIPWHSSQTILTRRYIGPA
jgi:hypothetical protein